LGFPTQPVQSLNRALQLLESLAEAAGRGSAEVGVVELARMTDLAPATAHRLLATLGTAGYVVHDESDARYRLGPRLFALASIAESSLTSLRERAVPMMEALRYEYGETINLAVLDRRHIVYVYQVESERPVRTFTRIGNRVLAHATAAGKALLAFESTASSEALLGETELEALTPNTITSWPQLVSELEAARVRGYAFDLGEQDEEVVCVAAPIPGAGRRPAGALSMSGPATRMRALDLDAVGRKVSTAAMEACRSSDA
jgi:IclR family acetate operon transcriptional repressor